MLTPYQIYLIFPILGAVFGAMLWLNYFKKIDILKSERAIDISIAFVIGFLTPTVSLWIYLAMEIAGFNFNGQLLNDLFYSIIGVGLTEELMKLVSVMLVFRLLKKRINEPIDYLIYAGIVALGFSIRENFIYYNNYGSQVITGRTFISCLTHIINTSICVYGLYRYQIFHKGRPIPNALVAITMAVFSHGLFDFFLTQPVIGNITPFLSTILYLIGINLWVQMINNAINYSPFFNYEKLGSITKLYKNVIFWYIALLVIEFSYALYYVDLTFATKDLLKNILKEGVLMTIVTLRISRLKINKRKYFPLKIQLPIYITTNDDEDVNLFDFIPLKIRGENENEFQFIKYMGKDLTIFPVDKEKSVLKQPKKARILKKYFLKNDVVTYLIEVYNENHTHKEIFLLKPQTRGITEIDGIHPVGILMYYENPTLFQKEHSVIPYKKLKQIEYVYFK